MYIALLILLVIFVVIISFIVGRQSGLHKYSKKMIDEALVGTLVVDMSSYENDLFQIEFDKNPKEFIHLDYIMMDLKIRK